MRHYFRVKVRTHSNESSQDVDVINAPSYTDAVHALLAHFGSSHEDKIVSYSWGGTGDVIRETATVVDAANEDTKVGKLLSACRAAGITPVQFNNVFSATYTPPTVDIRNDKVIVLDCLNQGYTVYPDLTVIATGG